MTGGDRITDDRLALLELVRRGAPGFPCQLLELTVHCLMEDDVAARCGAGRYERTDERLTQCNGYRPRVWRTWPGLVELQIPKLRRDSYDPSFLDREGRREFLEARREPGGDDDLLDGASPRLCAA